MSILDKSGASIGGGRWLVNEIKKVDASPTKSFFVRMVTRDISLEDCIFDLIDNSIDGAWKLSGGRPMALSDGVDLSQYEIDIRISDAEFIISDNCGGITFDDAVNYAFTFGRKEQEHDNPYSIGVYGIGMKRAVFKIGASINIHSTYAEAGKMMSFVVPINVPEWLANEGEHWDFNIDAADNRDDCGVEIKITDLTESVVASFGNPAFIQNLKRMISRDYSIHLHRGLVIKLNGDTVEGWPINLLDGGEFSPMSVEYREEIDGAIVNVEVFAGMAAPPPDDVAPSESDQGDKRYGWYVVCNGRVVLAADKTAQSGWGTDDWPQWHRQYAGFIGIIMFSSAKTALLPLTTTKRNVDVSSEVFRRAQPRMRKASRKWIDYTNHRKQAIEEARIIEARSKPLPIFNIKRNLEVKVPQFEPKPKVRTTTISYSMPIDNVKRLAQALGDINMTNKDVGIRSFEYTYDDHVEDE